VSLFVASVAFDATVQLEGIRVQDAAKMGALFSFGAAIVAIVAGKICRVEKQNA
jgi:NhaA family Na+:H+ antiporter